MKRAASEIIVAESIVYELDQVSHGILVIEILLRIGIFYRDFIHLFLQFLPLVAGQTEKGFMTVSSPVEPRDTEVEDRVFCDLVLSCLLN